MSRHSGSAWHQPLEQLADKTGRGCSSTLTSFLALTVCALSAGAREEMYVEEAARWAKDVLTLMSQALALLVEAMERHPFADLLGEVYTEWSWSKDKQRTGEYYTPQPVCDLMARMMITDIPDKRPITLSEPACGSGRMILASAKVLADNGVSPSALWVEARDLSKAACFMTFINTTLWGIPCRVIHSNTLSLEAFGTYENIFWYPLPQRPEETMKVLEPVIRLGGKGVQGSLFDDAA